MSYKKSSYRIDFENRIKFLKGEAAKANGLPATHHDIRDMAFQCAVFQTSAAVETYLRLSVESWFQQIKLRSLGAALPDNLRGHLATRKFSRAFERYVATREELPLSVTLGAEKKFWDVMIGAAALPSYLAGKDVHDGVSYPSYKNLHRLFSRIGVQDVHGRLAAILKRDIETMIEGFQSVRTALAHSAPPTITLKDVRSLLSDMADLVRALDRILHHQVRKHGGDVCWK
jgi:hypothetical protein